jgi:hypothetical protein
LFGAYAFVFSTAIHELLRVVVNAAVYCAGRRKRGDSSFKVHRSLYCLRWLVGNPLRTSEQLGK